MDDIVDLVSRSDDDLRALIAQLEAEEREISRRRRILHGKLDILRAELVMRLQRKHAEGESVISADDVAGLSRILAGQGPVAGEPADAAAPATPRTRRSRRVLPRVRHPQLRGSQLLRPLRGQPHRRPARVGHHDQLRARRGGRRDHAARRRAPATRPASSSAAAAAGRARPTRSGDERVTIGRHPDAAIFLDDVTVSRNHAVVVREGDAWVIVDEGSLNGTYVNRRRGDRTVLGDGDEIQIGKYKLTFIVPGAERPGGDVTETAELLFDVGDEKLLTIGSVVERLRGEFPDISVSKLRYLEEQGLVTPRRTKSGYRLYSQDDFTRLVRVLEHAARRVPAAQGHPPRARAQPRRPAAVGPPGPAQDRPPERGGGARVHRRGDPAAHRRRRRPARRARGVRARARPPGQRREALHRDRRRHRRRRRRSSRSSACAPRTCASSRAPSIARSASSSRSCCRRSAPTVRSGGARASTSSTTSSRPPPSSASSCWPAACAGSPAATAARPLPACSAAAVAPTRRSHDRRRLRPRRPRARHPRLPQGGHPVPRHHAAPAGPAWRCARPSTASSSTAPASTSTW